MVNLQNFTTSEDLTPFIDDLTLCIAFHIPNDSSPENIIIKLDHVISRIFGRSQTLDNISGNENNHEVIYKVHKPLMNSFSENREFFNKLDELFNLTHDIFPHFTQLHHTKKNKEEIE